LAADPQIRRLFLGACHRVVFFADFAAAQGVAMPATTRRTVLKGAAAAMAAAPFGALAQGEPLRFGVLTPLTGAGGQDGPRMLKAIQTVIDEVNKAGGVLR